MNGLRLFFTILLGTGSISDSREKICEKTGVWTGRKHGGNLWAERNEDNGGCREGLYKLSKFVSGIC